MIYFAIEAFFEFKQGPGDAPGEHGSAALRRSTRYTGSGVTRNSEVRSSTFSGNRGNSDLSQGNGPKSSARQVILKAILP